jgi:hypothetical protein
MSKSITMKSGNKTFLIETDDSVTLPTDIRLASVRQPDGIPEGMQPVVSLERVEGNFSDVNELIVTCSNSLFESISQLKNPKKMAIEFGIKLAGETGIPMLTKASGEANFKVSIEWEKDG